MTAQKPPGVFVTERPSGARMITGAGTSTPAFLGYTKVLGSEGAAFSEQERKVPQLVRSWREFADRYDIEQLAALRKDDKAGARDTTEVERCFTLAEAVYGFFANGGQSCYVVGFTKPAEKVTAVALKGDPEARTGIGGLETVPDVAMVAVPSLWDMISDVSGDTASPPQVSSPSNDDLTAGKALIDAVLAHCTKMRDRLAVIDAPPAQLPEPLKAFVGGLGPRHSDDAAFTALYYPWVNVPGVDGSRRTVPPSGHIAGVWARTDFERGVFKAPANQNLRGVLDIPTLLTDDQQGELNGLGVNCLRVFPGRGLLVWGARTRSDSRDWRYLNVRRLICFLADSIRDSSTWAVFEPNDDRLWATLRHSVTSFLTDQWRQGALQGRTPDEAFYVVCDQTNNTEATMDAGQVICDIGIAPVRPAEFVHFTITQMAGQPG
ncbi:phage tail sheath family protein [Streptomyces sp. NPDC054765]